MLTLDPRPPGEPRDRASAPTAPAPAPAAVVPPARRAELLVRPLGNKGDHVVKDPATGGYFNLGPEESFLLLQLDGRRDADAICRAFEEQFGGPLTGGDLEQFLALARAQGFLREVQPAAAEAKPRQSILFWRKSVFDPDRLFSRLEPRLRFVWTRGFAAASAAFIALAALLVWVNGNELAAYLPRALSPTTLALAWLTLVVATTLHEFAHGLTCKHYGGEVREVGFLLLFFMPCFYCNVSDAWLFREKSKRLLVTLAGGYLDLVLAAAAAVVWRVAATDTTPSYLAWVVLGVCGFRAASNFNPLIKLDGYYLLSDWLELPNLRQRAWDRFAAHLRWLLWGARRPAAEPRGRTLLAYGAASWLFSFAFLGLMLGWLLGWLSARFGLAGAAAAAALAVASMRGMFHGWCAGEVKAMFQTRRARVAAWVFGIAALVALAALVPVEDRAGGAFEVRPVTRVEVRAPLAGFLREVRVDEGDRVTAGAPLARLEAPDLSTRIAQKRAEVAEAAAAVALLRARPLAGDEGAPSATIALAIRREELAAADARLSRLEAEAAYLADLDARCAVNAVAAGVVTTAHLREKVGAYLKEGDLICVVEDPADLVVEVALDEREAARVRAGQPVELKANAYPFRTFPARVQRVAPAAAARDPERKDAVTVTAYCALGPHLHGDGPLRSGMTGHARVTCGRAPIAVLAAERVMRRVRTELWW